MASAQLAAVGFLMSQACLSNHGGLAELTGETKHARAKKQRKTSSV